jgi:hypothetical protein
MAVIVFIALTIYAKPDCWVDESWHFRLSSTVSTFFVDIYNLQQLIEFIILIITTGYLLFLIIYYFSFAIIIHTAFNF